MYRNKQQYGRAIEDYNQALAILAAQPADDTAVAIAKVSILGDRCYARSMLPAGGRAGGCGRPSMKALRPPQPRRGLSEAR
jgi:hypothetical protein